MAEQDGAVFAYAYAVAFKPREAYALSAELSVYVDRPRQGKGVGRALYNNPQQNVDSHRSTRFAQVKDHASATSSLPQALRMNAEREMPSFLAAASMAASSKS